jgi:hypothetical protein
VPRPTKNEKRIATILARLPLAREQMIVAMEEFGAAFDIDAFIAAAEHEDPSQRNKVAVIEREIDLLTNLLEELAARAIAEGRRLGAIDGDSTHPWTQLAAEKVIPTAMAEKLREAKDTRNDLDHFYPPTSWKAVHHATQIVLGQLDGYVTRVMDWAHDIGIGVPADR